MTDIVEQAARRLQEAGAPHADSKYWAKKLADAGLLRDPTRTMPNRAAIAQALYINHRDAIGDNATAIDLAEKGADAVLELLAGKPTVAEAKARAWEEGAQAAWLRTGEGWNGEYAEGTHDGSRSFRDCNPDTPNPYRTQDGK